MINLPDTDGFGVFGGETDAFVEIQIGKLDEFGTFVYNIVIVIFVYIYTNTNHFHYSFSLFIYLFQAKATC